MYSVTVTPGTSSDKSGSTSNPQFFYKRRRKESIPEKVFKFLKNQLQTEDGEGELVEQKHYTIFELKYRVSYPIVSVARNPLRCLNLCLITFR